MDKEEREEKQKAVNFLTELAILFDKYNATINSKSHFNGEFIDTKLYMELDNSSEIEFYTSCISKGNISLIAFTLLQELQL